MPVALYVTARILERDIDERLASLSLSLRLVGVLGHISRGSSLSYSELARRGNVTAQSMHATVRGLLADGVVVSEGNAGQAAALRLTPVGKRRLADARGVLAGYEDELSQAAGIDPRALTAQLLATATSAWRIRTPAPM